MKELVIHIGCGKTGSSALQSWLALNQRALAGLGYGFHVSNPAALRLHINSGNGGMFERLLRDEALDERRLQAIFFRGQERAIISGENFQLLDEALLVRLCNWAESRSIKITVVCFVRNVYDCLYSGYLQTVKRRNQTKTFAAVVSRISHYRHIAIVNRWARHFDLQLVHYDQCSNDVAAAFCRAAGIAGTGLKSILPRRVNRGLSSEERIVMQAMVGWLQAAGQPVPADFSRRICDDLVNNFPDVPVVFELDTVALSYMQTTFQAELNSFNQGIGRAQGVKLEILGDRVYAQPPEDSRLDQPTLQRLLVLLDAHKQQMGPAVLAAVHKGAQGCFATDTSS